MAKILKGILSLFGGRQDPPSPEAPAPRANPIAIPPPPDMPVELLDRVPTRQPRPAHRKGKRRTPEEIATNRAAHTAGMKAQAAQRFEFERGRVEAIGVTHYRWRTAGDSDVCDICAGRHGMSFPYRAASGFQHPGLVDCGTEACRCYAEPILPE